MVFNEISATTEILSILPDCDPTEVRDALLKLHSECEGKEIQAFLQAYFKKKDGGVSIYSLKREARDIVKLFPFYSVEYVTERLQVLGDEQNRVVIVIRQLLAKHKECTTKANSLQEQEINIENLKKYCTEELYAKNEISTCPKNKVDFGENTDGDSDFQNKPSTSKDISVNVPCTLSKPATIVSTTPNLDMLCEAATNAFELPKKSITTKKPDPSNSIIQTIEEVIESCASNAANSSLNLIEQTVKSKATSLDETPKNHGDATSLWRPIELIEEMPPMKYDLATRPTMKDVTEIYKMNCQKSSKQKPTFSLGPEFDNNAQVYTSIPKICSNFDAIEASSSKSMLPPRNFTLKPATFNLPVTKAMNVNTDNNCGKYEQSNSSGDSGEFNLVHHLKEVFTNKTEEDLYSVCSHYNIDVYKIPSEHTFDLIVQELMAGETEDMDAPEDLRVSGGNENNTKEPEPKEKWLTQPASKKNEWGLDEAPAAKKAKTCTSPPSIPIHVSDTDSYDETSDIDEMDVDTELEAISLLDEVYKPQSSYDNKLTSTLMEMFPDACPIFIKRLCAGKTYSPEAVDGITNQIFSVPEYPKRKQTSLSPEPELDPEKQFLCLKEILPDADPNYLRLHAELYINDQEKLKNFISNAFDKKNYPTMKEYMRKQQLSAQEKQYTTEFKVEKFLEVIPDPEKYFNDDQRKKTVSNERGDLLYHYAFKVLKNMYSSLPIRTISTVFTKCNFDMIRTKKELDKYVFTGNGLMKSKRKPMPITETVQNIPFLQEIAYVEHQNEILLYIQKKNAMLKEEKDKAKIAGVLQTCNCCYDDEVMPDDIQMCENGCLFCKTCIQKSVEIAFGEGKLDFSCLGDCQSHFSLQTLQLVLSPKLFSKMAQKKQLEEVKAAGIEDLEMCPFCDFATIPAPGDKIFRCFNSECMKESCRECKEPSHIPLRCDEIEKDDDVKRRLYIENKMTEALLRKCYKCGLKFIKSDGCNKMTCSCGAMMCYVCGEPVKDYTHFNGQGGDKYHLCPLYSDTNKLHQEDVLKGAQEAKVEIGVNDDPSKLKIDPTADVEKHYAQNPPQTLPPGMARLAPPVVEGRGDVVFPLQVDVRVNEHRHFHRHHLHHYHHHQIEHHVHPRRQ